MQVARLIGGAGTGKTSELLNIMKSVMAEIGNDPSAIGFASFTRAARAEMVDRAAAAFDCHPTQLSGQGGWFSTVHAVCRRMLGISSPDIISGDTKSTEWISAKLRVPVGRAMSDDCGYSTWVGDDVAKLAMTLWETSRNRIESLEHAHRRNEQYGTESVSLAECRHFIDMYETAKRIEGRVDFVDMLGMYCGVRFDLDGPEETDPQGELPPGVRVWFFDEAQDSSKLVDRVCRRLAYGDEVQWTYLAADPFQSVYGFGGADYRNFLGWAANKERTMPQSYRCPPPVMELGEKCLRRMKTGYFDRGIAPAKHEGSVSHGVSIDQALRSIDPLRSTLVLARCRYSLDAASSVLSERKIPHGRIGERDITELKVAYNALWKLEHGVGVSNAEWKAAIAELPVKATGSEILLQRGQKAAWGDGRRSGVEWFPPEEIETSGGGTPALAARIRDGAWAGLVDRGGVWYAAAKRHGPLLATTPNVRLSTVHGAKGMEAQDVVLITDTSRRVEEGRECDPEQADEECRLEYVAVTRAKEQLVICESESANSMCIPR